MSSNVNARTVLRPRRDAYAHACPACVEVQRGRSGGERFGPHEGSPSCSSWAAGTPDVWRLDVDERRCQITRRPDGRSEAAGLFVGITGFSADRADPSDTDIGRLDRLREDKVPRHATNVRGGLLPLGCRVWRLVAGDCRTRSPTGSDASTSSWTTVTSCSSAKAATAAAYLVA
jgi:hypothetical protein